MRATALPLWTGESTSRFSCPGLWIALERRLDHPDGRGASPVSAITNSSR